MAAGLSRIIRDILNKKAEFKGKVCLISLNSIIEDGYINGEEIEKSAH